ncbi:MAG TPA: 50S ribosomal protein L29 [Candidatus Saccharimonadales bacterium]|jgi:large subunit ribosomal protein L29|nr:50S ribosomal protein L29 [Candidatus Saccharimonadales bacterium]
MKIVDVRKMTTEELTKQTSALQQEIVEMRRRLYSGEATNVRALRSKRKDLARVYTVLGEKLQKENA